jgi:CubicO group peptidase (beta-lactamase class C family)
MKKLLAFAISLLLSGIVIAQEIQLPSFIRDSLDNYVANALKEWRIPGAAVGIVKDGKVVLLRGYGEKELGTGKKVDENTLFMIGSNTKAFTATAIAMLDAGNKLSLNDKVQKWLRDFSLYDPWVSKEVIVKDLLCHRLGFETFQGDFMFFDSDLNKDEVRKKLSKVKPLYGFRSRWGYCNAAFLTAGEIIPKVTGISWAQFIRDSIFKPLGMNQSLALTSEVTSSKNISSAHTIADGVLKKIPYGNLENMSPAGSISSSVSEMSNWLIMQLANGKFNGKQVVPSGAILQTRTPASILGDGGTLFNRGHFSLYGLGWFLQEYQNRKLVEHTGGVNGFVTSVALVPEENLGILVFTNTDANIFFEALRWEILDAFLGLPFRNYSKVYLDQYNTGEKGKETAFKLKQDTITMKLPVSVPLKAFNGEYEHEVYGKMHIKESNGKLVADFEHHKGRFAELHPLGGNRFFAVFNDPLFGKKVWPFTIADGKVVSVTVRVADFVEFTSYEFFKRN